MANANWVIDATMGARDGALCFCPVEGDIHGEDFCIVFGMMVLSDKVPNGGKLVGVVHEDGQEAVEAFCAEHDELIANAA